MTDTETAEDRKQAWILQRCRHHAAVGYIELGYIHPKAWLDWQHLTEAEKQAIQEGRQ